MVRDARRAPDRLMHARRRAALLARLRESAPPRRILFVCHGNIIRSPFAEHLARAWLPPPLRGRIEFSSAGFIGPGRPSPPEAVEAALLWDIDLSSHRSRLLSSEELACADLVLVVEPRQRRGVQYLGCPARRIAVLGDLDPQPVESREIVDPFGRPGVVLLESYRRIVRCVDALLGALAAAGRAPAGWRAGPSLSTAVDPEGPWAQARTPGARTGRGP